MHYKLTFIIDNNVDNQDIESTLKSIINNNEQFLKFIKIIIVSNEKIDNLILKEINSYKKEKTEKRRFYGHYVFYCRCLFCRYW